VGDTGLARSSGGKATGELERKKRRNEKKRGRVEKRNNQAEVSPGRGGGRSFTTPERNNRRRQMKVKKAREDGRKGSFFKEGRAGPPSHPNVLGARGKEGEG